MNLYRVLRHLVPEEIKALLEKIDTLERYDSSSYPIEHLCRNGNFTRLERKLLSNAVARVRRRQTLSDAMHIVIYGTVEASTEAISGGLIQASTGTFTYQNPVKVIKKVAPYGHP